jgi:hypothetical protein
MWPREAQSDQLADEQSVPMISNRKVLVDPKHRLRSVDMVDVTATANRIERK